MGNGEVEQNVPINVVKDYQKAGKTMWDQFAWPITQVGFTPLYLMFGRQAKLLTELMCGTPATVKYRICHPTSNHLWLSHMRRWQWQPLGNLTMKQNFTTREAIWSRQSYMGFIYTSTQRKVKTVPPMIKHLTYRVQDIHNQRKRMVVHFNRLKPYKQWVQTQVKDKAACM